jgi:hypothetical protein
MYPKDSSFWTVTVSFSECDLLLNTSTQLIVLEQFIRKLVHFRPELIRIKEGPLRNYLFQINKRIQS